MEASAYKPGLQASTYPSQGWERAPAYAAQTPRRGVNWELLAIGAIGLGLLAWYNYGPDFMRYMKIRSM